MCSGEPTVIRDLLHLIVEVKPGSAPVAMPDSTEAPGRSDDIPWIVGSPLRLKVLTSFIDVP